MISPITRNGCTLCPAPAPPSVTDSLMECPHIRSMFNSTKNVKRRIHTFLFWKRMLGLAFPVLDIMLRDCVWKNLESCVHGIK
jgi:hypothetical protein